MSKTKEKTYVTSTCLNSKLKDNDPNYCDRAFHVIDKGNAKSNPPCVEYCKHCKAKGFKKDKNIKCGRNRNLTEEQRKAIGERLKAGRLLNKDKLENI